METFSGNLLSQCIIKMKLNLPLETQVLSSSNMKAFLALFTKILNTCFEKESERKSPIVIATEMLKGLFQLPSVFLSIFLKRLNSPERDLWHSLMRTNISFHLLSPKTMLVCKGNKESHTTLATYFRKYYPACSTVMTADAEIFFLSISIFMNILYKDHQNAVLL